MDSLKEAEKVFDIEARAILDLKSRLNDGFESAVETLFRCTGKVVVTGMGKSGLIGKKIASTLSSTGTPAVFLHPAESSHGDLGIVVKGDVILAMSYSGETSEMMPVLTFAARKDVPVIAMTGNPKSTLAQTASVVLDVGVRQEACPLGLAPTASTTATLAMGDALAVALLKRRGFRTEDFAEFHPGGSLGHRLLTRVKDVMHAGDALPLVQRGASMKEVITKMTAREVRGVAGVVDERGDLMAVITDGDLRRRLERSQNPLQDRAEDLMHLNPKTVDMNELAEKALFMMEQFSIQVLFVVDRQSSQAQKPVGILHLQDLLKSRVR